MSGAYPKGKRYPEIDAEDITSGTLALARLSGLTKDQLAAAAGLLLTQMEEAVCSETELAAGITAHGISAKHRWALNKVLIGAGAEDNPTEAVAILPPQLTVEGFRYSAATGTLTDPEAMNDGDTGTPAYSGTIGAYAQVTFFLPSKITQFRQYGHTSNQAGDKWKIQYQDIAGDWHDWVTNIDARAASWSNWDSSGGEVIAQAIKLILTAQTITVYMGELEVKF